jgi:hypothetical protein
MEAVLARVLEVLAADVVAAVRAHESYKDLVAGVASQAVATMSGRSSVQPAAGPTSGA